MIVLQRPEVKYCRSHLTRQQTVSDTTPRTMTHEARAGSSTKRARFSPESVDALLDSLNRLKLNQPKAVSQTIHIYEPLASDDCPDDSHKRYITSWKMQEHLYRRKDCPFPTLARGIFTAAEDFSLQQPQQRGESSKDSQRKRIRIVARGYDKFFNIGEVPWTEVGEHPLYAAKKCQLTRITVGQSRKVQRGTV